MERVSAMYGKSKWDGITYPFLNFNRATVEIQKWISNFISFFTEHVITYPCWDQSYTMLVKWDPCIYVTNIRPKAI